MPGVVEHGLFLGLADVALIGRDIELHGTNAANRTLI
jgi:ribose 5-phosphate isomerase